MADIRFGIVNVFIRRFGVLGMHGSVVTVSLLRESVAPVVRVDAICCAGGSEPIVHDSDGTFNDSIIRSVAEYSMEIPLGRQ